MYGRFDRHMAERSMEVGPVVSYSLIPPGGGKSEGPADPGDDGRVEPRLTVLPMERKARFDEVAAPTRSEVSEHSGGTFHTAPVDPLIAEPEKRRRGFPVVVMIGLAALLVGFGVLAATFSKVVTGGGVTQSATVDTPAVALAPPPAPTEETAGPGVRAIPPSATAPLTDATMPPEETSPSDTSAPSAVQPDTQSASTGATTIDDLSGSSDSSGASTAMTTASGSTVLVPLPRLRPPGTAADIAALPQTMPQVAAPAAPAAPAPASGASGDDTDSLMANVDKLIAERRAANAQTPTAAAPPVAALPPLGQPALAPSSVPVGVPPAVAQPPVAAATTANVAVMGGAAVALAQAPQVGTQIPAGPQIIAPPVTGDAATVAPLQTRPSLYPSDPSLPTPPADIPDPEGAPGQ